jgi:hypothetical protein
MLRHDVFISHASEDKQGFVRQLAESLRGAHLDVWYDEFTLELGDSLRREIDRGLATSQYGIVVLSPAFFSKRWTNYELDGLVQLHAGSTPSRLLPIWHEVDAAEVTKYSPPLANLYAVNTGEGLDAVVAAILRRLRPAGSTLLHARDELVELGYTPPVVTDDWWLDVVEASASNDVEGTFQESMGWGRWGFPLPERTNEPRGRGHRLAWAAAQMMWQKAAEEQRISQVTPPEEVHEFIQAWPGLETVSHQYPSYLVSYAPQLSIRGFEGPFADDLEHMCRHFENPPEGARQGMPDYLLLRDPRRYSADPALLACSFVQGDIMGPQVTVYDVIDYVAWILSAASEWMPAAQRAALLDGLKQWKVWPGWHKRDVRASEGLYEALAEKPKDKNYLRADAVQIVARRLAESATILGLPETGDELVQRFLTENFIAVWRRKDRQKR